MKKNVIALLLSVVLAAGSIGTVPALAAETDVQEETSVENIEEAGREAALASEEEADAGLTEEASAAETEQAAEEEEETETDEPAENASEAETEQAAEEEPEEGTEDADAGLTDEESSEGESAQETEEEPEQTDAESVDEDENADEQDQTAAVEEDADDEIDDSATIADTEETAVTEDESIIEESKEAKLAGNVVASGTCGANATWTLTGTDDDLTLTISGSGDMDHFEKSDIPWASKQAKIKTLIVEDGITGVGDYAFYSLNKLTNVSLAGSVKKLWQYCFSNCVSLKSITLPASVTYIGWSAFSGCSSLTSITIPDSADIGGNAFEGCSSLTSITIPSSVTDIGWYAFSGCSNLTSITIPDSVTEIGGYAFEGCSGLTSITLPDSVTSIGEYAFYGCSSLTSITIPDSVTSIGDYAFDFCDSLEKIQINSLEAWLNIDDHSSYLSGNLYLNGELITNAIIPEGITRIRDGAFSGCSGLTSITIPDSVTSIGDYAFYDCSSLEKMHINSLEAWLSIDDDSYHECNLYLNGELLTNAIIPDGITHIRDYAFRGCSRLRNVTIPDSVISIGSFAFEDCSSLKSITIPDSVTRINQYTFNGCSSLTSITLPDSVTSIGSSAFEGCSSLKSITIPNNVKEIDQYAFLGVELEKIQINSLETWLGLYDDYSYLSGPLYLNGKLLTDAVIPAGITRIRDYAFNGCSSLRSVTIPDSVTVIGHSAFYKCNSLTSVTIPDSVTEIEAHAFNGCSLTDITIPDSVTSMDHWVFEGCSNLTKIVVGSGIKSISPSGVIDQCVGDNLTEDGTYAIDGFFGECENLKSIIIKYGMTEIKGYAFLGYSNLTSVTIPASVTRIGGHAFKHCGSLRSVTIPASVTDIGEGAFGGPATKISVRFCGTKAQWDAATAGRDVYCNSITYNCFSVDAAVSLSGTSFTYNKKAIKPAVTVTYGGKKLVEGTDYKLVYKNNINAGKATVYINGTGKYSGTVTRTFTIKKAVNKITAKNFTLGYSAKKRSFALEAKITNGTPKYASNSKSVTVSAKGVVTVSPKFIGKATITITAPEYINYSKTTKKVTVTVRPPRSAFKSVTNSASRQMTLKWITSPMVTGYHIQYSVSSKFTKFKSIWITKGSINTSTVKNLTKD